jgi:DNA repair protein RecO (recombination protein O)
MIIKTEAIVLNYIKYSDNSFIVAMYTKELGRKSFMFKRTSSKKSRVKTNILQPLTLLNIEFEYKSKKNFQYIKNIQIANPSSTIILHISKFSLAFFWAEILDKSVIEEEANKNLFEYVYNNVQILDIKTKGIANLNIYFILHLTKYLGFFPNDNYSEINKYFDIKTSDFKLIRPFSMDEHESYLLYLFLQYSENQNENYEITYEYRKRLLESVVDYYSVHIDNIKNIKTLSVLQEVFH